MKAAIAALAVALVLLSAAAGAAQTTRAPLITVHLGAVTTREVCQLSRQSSTIGPTMGALSLIHI